MKACHQQLYSRIAAEYYWHATGKKLDAHEEDIRHLQLKKHHVFQKVVVALSTSVCNHRRP